MFLAPNRGGHGANLPINIDNAELVSARSFHRRNVEAENIPGLVCTRNVNWKYERVPEQLEEQCLPGALHE
jgi:hypothetical protein